MEQLILIVNVLAALGIVSLVMLQQGKGADMGASFGAGASQTLFGSGGGGNVLTKTTAWLVALFFVTSFGLAVIVKNKAGIAGEVGIPVPAVVESKDMPQVPADSGEIPQLDEAALERAMEQGGLDIPGIERAGDAASDIPAI
ncbi:MAG: preprotein translocase subunit SecG [Pseudomonadales bacterium]